MRPSWFTGTDCTSPPRWMDPWRKARHTHVRAGQNLKRATYIGQFGFIYVDPATEPGDYDQEIFVALKEWEPYMSSGGEDEDSLDVAYKSFSINGRALGHGEPIRVKAGQRVLLRILNASATVTRRIDAVVEMNQPGVWILGATDDHDREHGMGVVIELRWANGPTAPDAPEHGALGLQSLRKTPQ
jgi:hypothetical protein